MQLPNITFCVAPNHKSFPPPPTPAPNLTLLSYHFFYQHDWQPNGLYCCSASAILATLSLSSITGLALEGGCYLFKILLGRRLEGGPIPDPEVVSLRTCFIILWLALQLYVSLTSTFSPRDVGPRVKTSPQGCIAFASRQTHCHWVMMFLIPK